MKYLPFIFSAIICPLFMLGQSVEVQGKLKVTDMDTLNTEELLVVKQADGTLAARTLMSLPPPPPDTIRTLESDLALAKLLCDCGGNMPPFLVQSTIDAGYSVLDLFNSGVPISNFINAGITAYNLFNDGITIEDLMNAGFTIDSLLNAEFTVLDLLNGGVTPIVLWEEGVSIDSLYGKSYAGGLIFFLDMTYSFPWEGLVSAPSDQSTAAEWGCIGTYIYTEGTYIGTGSLNTTNIDNECATPGIAADLCINLDLDGYDDWFLPSQEELHEMWAIIGHGAAGANYNIGNFSQAYYWSSSHADDYTAWTVNFDQPSGNGVITSKDDYLYVRAIRAF